MDLSQLLEKLKTTEGFGDEAVGVITAHTESLRTEAKSYRTKGETTLGKLTKLAERLGVTPDGDLDAALDTRLKAAGKPGGDDETRARLQRLEQDLADSKKARLEAETRAHRTSAQNKISEYLNSKQVVALGDLTKLHLSDAKFREDGSPYFVDASGAERSIEEHLGAWLKDRPELVKSNQQRGPGGGGAPPPHTAGKKVYTEDQYNEAVASNDTTILTELATGKALVA